MNRKRELEEGLARALFHLAALPIGTSPESLCREVERGGYGALSSEFGSARRQMAAGASVAEAFSQVGLRSGSSFVKRTMSLIASSFQTGADSSSLFAELAQDAFDQLSLAREAASQSLLQKYTVLAASGIAVPFVLGMLLGMVDSLGASMQSGLLSDFSAGAGVSDAVALGAHAYLIEFAFLAAVFASFSEGRRERLPHYFVALAVTSQVVFLIARSHALF